MFFMHSQPSDTQAGQCQSGTHQPDGIASCGRQAIHQGVAQVIGEMVVVVGPIAVVDLTAIGVLLSSHLIGQGDGDGLGQKLIAFLCLDFSQGVGTQREVDHLPPHVPPHW